jgi:hypothetical protein
MKMSVSMKTIGIIGGMSWEINVKKYLAFL